LIVVGITITNTAIVVVLVVIIVDIMQVAIVIIGIMKMSVVKRAISAKMRGGDGMSVGIDRLTHASVCLDLALEYAEDGNEDKMNEYINKCLDSLGIGERYHES